MKEESLVYDNILISNLEKVTMRSVELLYKDQINKREERKRRQSLLNSNVYLRSPWMKMRLEHGLLIVI